MNRGQQLPSVGHNYVILYGSAHCHPFRPSSLHPARLQSRSLRQTPPRRFPSAASSPRGRQGPSAERLARIDPTASCPSHCRQETHQHGDVGSHLTGRLRCFCAVGEVLSDSTETTQLTCCQLPLVADLLSRAVPVLDTIAPQQTFAGVASGDSWFDGMCRKVHRSPHKYPLWRLEGDQLFKRVDLPYPDLAEDPGSLLSPNPNEPVLLRRIMILQLVDIWEYLKPILESPQNITGLK